MKKTLLSFAVLGTLALASCEKIKDVLFPSFETSTGEITVPIPIVVSTSSEIELGSAYVNYNVDSVIRKYTANQFGIDNAESVKVKSVVFDMPDTDPLNNFSNFESLKLSVFNNSKPTPVAVANATITSSASPIVVNGNDVDLKEYLKESRIGVSLSGKVVKPTTRPLQLTLDVTLKVN